MSTGLGIGTATTVAAYGVAAIGMAGATSALFGGAEIAESFIGKNGIKQYYGEPIYNQIYAGSMFISSAGMGAMSQASSSYYGGSGRTVQAKTERKGKTDFYVTPSGDVVPATKEGLNKNLSLLENNNGKYVGEGSNGPVRIRAENAHPATTGFNGDGNPDHLIDHIHIEHRQNGLTGPWGKGINTKTTIPQDWLD